MLSPNLCKHFQGFMAKQQDNIFIYKIFFGHTYSTTDTKYVEIPSSTQLVLTLASFECPLAALQNSLTNHNLFHTIAVGIPCFLFLPFCSLSFPMQLEKSDSVAVMKQLDYSCLPITSRAAPLLLETVQWKL